MTLILGLGMLQTASAAAVKLYTNEGRAITLTEAARECQAYDVVFFNEFHDNRAVHEAQSEFFQAMYKQDADLTLSLEMVERDCQDVLNKYLRGEVDEEYFLSNSRPWKNYVSDYRPLVVFAKEHSLETVAANIPRRMAAQYARSGSLGGIDAGDRQYLPQRHIVEQGAYYVKFKNYMQSAMGGKMPITPERIDNLYKAQCLKDDTMAESIMLYAKQNPKKKIVHLQGSFHGAERLGVVEKLAIIAPQIKTVVITPIFIEAERTIAENVARYKHEGEYILFLEK